MFFRKSYQTEDELLKGCQNGDKKAQRALYERYSSRFFAICLRYTKDRFVAEDVLVEGFMKIFERLHQFENKGSFEGWMKKIMVTQALLKLRSNKHLNMEVLVDESRPLENSGYEITHLEAADLMELIAELPVGYRTVFNLYAIEGYSHQEIAALLGITESTSKSQLNRARGVLKEKIAGQQLKERSING